MTDIIIDWPSHAGSASGWPVTKHLQVQLQPIFEQRGEQRECRAAPMVRVQPK